MDSGSAFWQSGLIQKIAMSVIATSRHSPCRTVFGRLE